MPVEVRNLEMGDIPAYVVFYNSIPGQSREMSEERALQMTFHDPDYLPEEHFIVISGGKILADCLARVNRAFMKVNGPVCFLSLHFLRHFAADAVIGANIAHLKKKGISRVRAWAPADGHIVEYFEDRGFLPIKEFIVMRAEPFGMEIEVPEGYDIRPAEFPKQEKVMLDLINLAFKDEFGWWEMDLHAFRRRYLSPEGTDTSGYFIAWKGKRAAGCVASYIKEKDNGIKEGDIRGLGVLPEYRGKGLGTALLQSSLNFYAERGIENAKLGVDAENREALHIYEKLGFEEEKRVLVMEGDVDTISQRIETGLSHIPERT